MRNPTGGQRGCGSDGAAAPLPFQSRKPVALRPRKAAFVGKGGQEKLEERCLKTENGGAREEERHRRSD